MRYTLTSEKIAENELAQIYVQAADRRAVQRASDRIDQLLRFSSQARGNDRKGNYQMTIRPLQVTYKVSPDDCLVTILHFHYVG